MPEPVTAIFDEVASLAARGTVVVLVGRGEHPGVYERLGRRLAADAWRVRVVPGHTDADVLSHARETLGGEPAEPVVLLGSDDGAARATRLATALGAEAVVLGGLVPAGAAPAEFAERAEEIAARTSCPTHRARLADDPGFEAGALASAADSDIGADVAVPVLAVHGAADAVVPLDAALATLETLPDVEIVVVRDGVHDVFNDITHRSVAATVVLFLERIRGGGAPIVTRLEAARLGTG